MIYNLRLTENRWQTQCKILSIFLDQYLECVQDPISAYLFNLFPAFYGPQLRTWIENAKPVLDSVFFLDDPPGLYGSDVR